MNYLKIQQQSPEWFDLKAGKISGTRYGQVISGRKNSLLYELANERLDGYIIPEPYLNDEMQFGIDNEPVALDLYESQSGIKFQRGGVIMSDFSPIHMASPDGVNIELGIVAEVKCTMNGAKHIQRMIEGVESQYLPQVKNYFTVSDSVKEVHWISYCPERFEKPLVVIVFKRENFIKEIEAGREAIRDIKARVDLIVSEWGW
jgi:hypothetical protein